MKQERGKGNFAALLPCFRPESPENETARKDGDRRSGRNAIWMRIEENGNMSSMGVIAELELNTHEENKLAEIWLTKEERRDPLLRESLKEIYREFKEKKFLVAVYESGDRNLAEATSDLICRNRKRSAELAMRQEEEQGSGGIRPGIPLM